MVTQRIPVSRSGADQEDRRVHPRITVGIQIEIRLEGSDVPMRMQTHDISEGGCYVESILPMEVGSAVHIVLWLNGEKFVATGNVVTRHPQFGNGIEFTSISDDDRVRLRQYLKTLNRA